MKKLVVAVLLSGMMALARCSGGAPQTDKNAASAHYIANANSGKLHCIQCDSLPEEQNRVYFATLEEAHSAGYTNHHKECMGDDAGETDKVSHADANYIANVNSGKLHSIQCDSLPAEQNRVYFATLKEAHDAGYTNHHKECMGG